MTNRVLLDQKPSLSRPDVGSFLRENAFVLALAALGFALLFRSTAYGLVTTWIEDSDFSHGFLVVPISAVILFASRKHLSGLPAKRSWLGLAVLLASIIAFFAGRVTVTDSLERIGLLGGIIGGTWYLLGPAVIQAKPFPFFFLVLAIPPPALLLDPVRMGLRRIATDLSSNVLLVLGVVAIPEGNTLSLGEHKLEVADACSGIRSLVAILAVAVLFAYLFRAGFWKGLLLMLTAIPVTILNNVLRIVVVAVALGSFQVDLTEGTAHDLLSLGTFTLSVGSLYLSWLFYDWLFGLPREAASR